MVFQQWEEVRGYYKAALPLNTLLTWHNVWAYRYFWVFMGFGLVCAVGAVTAAGMTFLCAVRVATGIGTDSFWRVLWVGSLLGFVLWMCLVSRAIRSACVKEFQVQYATYGLDPSHDIRHLQYVRFLNRLADQQYTRADIATLRRVAEIAEVPTRPAMQFADHPLFWLLLIVPSIGGLWTLGADLIKKSEIWEIRAEAQAMLILGVLLVVALICLFFQWQHLVSLVSRKAQYQEIQRFLQWAEHDIQEAQLLRTQYLRAEAPGPHGPSR